MKRGATIYLLLLAALAYGGYRIGGLVAFSLIGVFGIGYLFWYCLGSVSSKADRDMEKMARDMWDSNGNR